MMKKLQSIKMKMPCTKNYFFLLQNYPDLGKVTEKSTPSYFHTVKIKKSNKFI